MKRKIVIAMLSLSASVLIVPTICRPHAVGSAAEPTINKASIRVITRRHTVYLATPNAEKDFTTWSWTPRVAFRVNGPMAGGSKLVTEFFLPGNKPWIQLDCGGGEINANQWWQVGDPFCGDEVEDEQGKTVTGFIDFKISLVSELQGTSKTLFTGKIDVKKFHVGGTAPEFKNNFEYYVDQDWTLPVGYVYALEPISYATGATQYLDFSPLAVSMWFRGDPTEGTVIGYVFYNGKPIGSTENTRRGTTSRETLSTSEDSPYKWSLVEFVFSDVEIFDRKPPGSINPDAFRLDKNPGEYEVKVLRNGKLARVAKFTVGADGKIVDNGIGKSNNLGAPRIILPIQILDAGDGDWNKAAWKTEAFYSNPLSGFTAP